MTNLLDILKELNAEKKAAKLSPAIDGITGISLEDIDNIDNGQNVDLFDHLDNEAWKQERLA